MRKIYFVRHSVRDAKIKDDYSAPLTIEGKQLAHDLVGYFVDKNIKAIYSSPYQRALQTIEPTATTLGIEINLNAELRERQTNDQIDWQNHLEKLWQNFYFKTVGEESLATVQQRMKTAFYQIIDESSGEIIITSHGTALSLLFHYLTSGYFNFIDWQKMEMPDVYIGLFDENNQCISLTKEAY